MARMWLSPDEDFVLGRADYNARMSNSNINSECQRRIRITEVAPSYSNIVDGTTIFFNSVDFFLYKGSTIVFQEGIFKDSFWISSTCQTILIRPREKNTCVFIKFVFTEVKQDKYLTLTALVQKWQEKLLVRQ